MSERRAKPSAKKAVVLLSGGLDSATVLYWALERGYDVRALVFDYGQRHQKEVKIALELARSAGVGSQTTRLPMPWKGSSLLDRSRQIPQNDIIAEGSIPSTYVPARNIIFLSVAAGFAEATGARAIAIGANALDYSGYPDCRPEFFEAYQKMLDVGIKAGVEKKKIKILTPLLHKSKAQIVRLGLKLGVPYEKTWSCYKGTRRPCGVCDSCRLRAKGFEAAKVEDPLLKL